MPRLLPRKWRAIAPAGGDRAKNKCARNLCIMMNLPHQKWALNSAVECHPHTVEVIGSNPIAPTISFLRLARKSSPRAQPTTQPISESSLMTSDPSLIPSEMRLGLPVFHRHHLGSRYPASSELVNDTGCSARSSVPPGPHNPGGEENEGFSARSWVPSGLDGLANSSIDCFDRKLRPLRELRCSNTCEFLG
jgi:hypothetical protein